MIHVVTLALSKSYIHPWLALSKSYIYPWLASSKSYQNTPFQYVSMALTDGNNKEFWKITRLLLFYCAGFFEVLANGSGRIYSLMKHQYMHAFLKLNYNIVCLGFLNQWLFNLSMSGDLYGDFCHTQNFSLKLRLVKDCKFWPMLVLMAIEQWELFNMPYLL